jgi:hypothetical protein
MKKDTAPPTVTKTIKGDEKSQWVGYYTARGSPHRGSLSQSPGDSQPHGSRKPKVTILSVAQSPIYTASAYSIATRSN